MYFTGVLEMKCGITNLIYFHDLRYFSGTMYHSVWSVIIANNFTPANRDSF